MSTAIRRQTGHLIIALAILAIVAAIPGQALAAKGGNGNGGGGGGGAKASIWIEDTSVQTTAAAESADAGMYYMGQVLFGHDASTTDSDNGRGPWIELRCEQDGEVVYREWRAGFEGGYLYGEPHNLGPSLAWDGDSPADCTGILGHYSRNFSKFMTDATVEFQVMP